MPHDAVHYFVEDGLGFTRGFWGIVAAGQHPEQVSELAKAAGHASSKRAQIPNASIIELLQAERLVECFEASLWDGGCAPDQFREIAGAACAASHVPLPELTDAVINDVALKVASLSQEWEAAPNGHVWQFAWNQN